MKTIVSLALLSLMLSCSKKQTTDTDINNDSKQIESLNTVRQKINDSINLKNEQNIFADLSGFHSLTFLSDDSPKLTGQVNFSKIGRDQYEVTGSAEKGKNNLKITGIIKRVSEKHLNFTGKIEQNIQGTYYARTEKTTFYNEGKGNFWRLQNKINGSGFVDYIDIHF